MRGINLPNDVFAIYASCDWRNNANYCSDGLSENEKVALMPTADAT